ncbi:MAG TPA: tripartite tricarboxylate transporter substrate binding protein [Burkholderiales bacterium]|nr:tripartite tricarboxylate transporter substrate binding protein [Burkholderiales bacterium]
MRSVFRALACAALGALTTAAVAQSYPTKPIRMIVAQAAGGPTDVVTRIYATKLSELLGQQIVVDNRVGAGGTIAGELVAQAPADGYTLCVMANGTAAIAPHLMTLKFQVLKDFAPVALIGDSPLALMVYPALPANSLKEMIALAKAKPGTLNFGSSGQGATGHLAGEMFKAMSGANIVHVPYKGAAPALVATMSGEIHMLFSALSSGMQYVKAKQLRALGITGPKRVPMLPDVPAIGEVVPGYEASSWYAVLTRAGTPRAVIDRVNKATTQVLTTPEVRAKLVSVAVDPEPLTPEQLGAKIRRDYERWGKVVKAAGVKVQ